MIRPPMIAKLKKKIKAMPEINLVDMEIPLSNGRPTQKLSDILEPEVDDSYFTGKAIVEALVAQSEFQEGFVSIKTPKKKK
jgi:hypothetical protein